MMNMVIIMALAAVLCAMTAFVETNTFRNIIVECLIKKGSHVVSRKKVDRIINLTLAAVGIPALTLISYIMIVCLFTPE